MTGLEEPLSMEERGIFRLRISSIKVETHQAKTFCLDFPDGQQLHYRSGQFVTLVFKTRHGEKRRSYSISSSPELNQPLSITVKRVENGEFSRLLLSLAKEGDILFCSGINGLFVLPGDIRAYDQYWFIAAGSGITPCFAMIKTVIALSSSKVVLIFSNRSEEDAIFYEELTALQHNNPERLIIYFLFSNRYDIYRSRLSSWLLEKILSDHLYNPDRSTFYLCGPFEYMRMATITLLSRVPADKILRENFNSFPRMVSRKPQDTDLHSVILWFKKELFKFDVQYPLTILQAAKSKKIPLPYSCESGRCGSCVARCIKGNTWMAYNEVLLDVEVAEGMVLLCQAYPVGGDVEIEC